MPPKVLNASLPPLRGTAGGYMGNFGFPAATSVVPSEEPRTKRTAAMQLYQLVQGTLESIRTPEGQDAPREGNVPVRVMSNVWDAEERAWVLVFRFGDGKPVIWRHTTEELVWLFRYYMLALNDDLELIIPLDFACAPRGDMAQMVVGKHPVRSDMGNNGWWTFEYFRVWVLQGKADWSDNQ
jgi:hypothetical protein